MGGLYEANLAINEVCPPLLDGPQKEKTGKLLMLLAAHTEGGNVSRRLFASWSRFRHLLTCQYTRPSGLNRVVCVSAIVLAQTQIQAPVCVCVRISDVHICLLFLFSSSSSMRSSNLCIIVYANTNGLSIRI